MTARYPLVTLLLTALLTEVAALTVLAVGSWPA